MPVISILAIYSPNLVLFISQKYLKHTHTCPHTQGLPCSVIVWFFPSLISCQLQIVPWLGVGPTPLLHAGTLSSLNLWKSYTCCHSPCEFICTSALLGLKNVVSFKPPTTTVFFCLFFHMDPWALWFDENISFSDECAKFLTLHTVWLWVSVSITLHCKNKLLWWDLTNAQDTWI